jgi:hypothetical protein
MTHPPDDPTKDGAREDRSADVEVPATEPPPVSFAPRRVGTRYELGEALGAGGTGKVYRALDREVGRSVALKTVRHGTDAQPDVIERFLREARVTAQLEHPNIVPVYELGSLPSGKPYYTMRVVKRQSLQDVLANDRAPTAVAARAPRRRLRADLAAPWPTPTGEGCSTATSSRRTSCSAISARCTWPTGATPRQRARSERERRAHAGRTARAASSPERALGHARVHRARADPRLTSGASITAPISSPSAWSSTRSDGRAPLRRAAPCSA